MDNQEIINMLSSKAYTPWLGVGDGIVATAGKGCGRWISFFMKPAGTMYITKKSTIVQTTLDLDTYVPGQ